MVSLDNTESPNTQEENDTNIVTSRDNDSSAATPRGQELDCDDKSDLCEMKDDGLSQDPEIEELQDIHSGVIVAEKPNVKWDEVVGLEDAKAALTEAVILPVKFPHLFTGKRTPWRGILLHGPTGAGKSHLAKAAATETKSTMFTVNFPPFVNKWQEEDSESLVKQLFERARESKPSIIFIDEIDLLAGPRTASKSDGLRRLKTEFLVQMSGVGHDDTGMFVIGETNIPWQFDNAIKRRFGKRIYVPLPDPDVRNRLLQLWVEDSPNDLSQEDFRILADKMDGYSGSDITVVVRDALLQPVRKVISATHFMRVADPASHSKFTKLMPCSPDDPAAEEMNWTSIEPDMLLEPRPRITDFLKTLGNIQPISSAAVIKRHDDWMKKFGGDRA